MAAGRAGKCPFRSPPPPCSPMFAALAACSHIHSRYRSINGRRNLFFHKWTGRAGRGPQLRRCAPGRRTAPWQGASPSQFGRRSSSSGGPTPQRLPRLVYARHQFMRSLLKQRAALGPRDNRRMLGLAPQRCSRLVSPSWGKPGTQRPPRQNPPIAL